MLRCIGRYWHLADIRCVATFCPLLDKSGQGGGHNKCAILIFPRRRCDMLCGMWLRLRNMASLSGALLAAEAFAVWTAFALPLFTGRATIREAWDTPAYWEFGVPVLLLSLVAAGYFSKEAPWKLALWTLAGHFLAMWLVNKPGTDLGLLPLTLVLIGAPAFGVLAVLAYVGRALKG